MEGLKGIYRQFKEWKLQPYQVAPLSEEQQEKRLTEITVSFKADNKQDEDQEKKSTQKTDEELEKETLSW